MQTAVSSPLSPKPTKRLVVLGEGNLCIFFTKPFRRWRKILGKKGGKGVIVRVEGITPGEAIAITKGLSLREVLSLARRIAEQIEMPTEQRRRQEIIFSSCPRHSDPAYTEWADPQRIVFNLSTFHLGMWGDFEASLIEELQHASDIFLHGSQQILNWASASGLVVPRHLKSLREFRAIVQVARLRPIPTVRWEFREVIEVMIKLCLEEWCGTVRPPHLRQAVRNALPQELTRKLVEVLRARGDIAVAVALRGVLEENKDRGST